ncbi:hypothetical protein G419_15527 [Rhodococcus triatomae BKS 15-14]|nr:hypothetical protein G419_15527 [Rhodococcus triatomae BKS 15-14]
MVQPFSALVVTKICPVAATDAYVEVGAPSGRDHAGATDRDPVTGLVSLLRASACIPGQPAGE